MILNKRGFLILVGVLCLAVGISNTTAQIHIAPTSLFMDDHQKTDRLVIRNSSNKPQEIKIDLIFGYPATDEQGNVFLKTLETTQAGESAIEWVRVYPRHLVLPPNEQQVVRFAARPPASLPPGEYWARPAISTSHFQEGESLNDSRISTQISIIKRTLLSLNYRHGKVQTGITIADFTAQPIEGRLHLLAELERKGNAAYLGDVRISIYDANKEISYQERKIAVYHSQQRRFEINVTGIPAGTYEARLTFRTEERAAKQNGILSATPTSKAVDFIIP